MADHAIAAGDLVDLGDLRGHLKVVGDPFRLTGMPIRVCLVDAGWGAGLGYPALILDLSSSTRVGHAQPAPGLYIGGTASQMYAAGPHDQDHQVMPSGSLHVYGYGS
jgi:hypothetical protein